MDLSRLDQVSLLHGLQDMFARLRIVDEGVTLGAVYELEVLSPELAEDRFRRHGERVPVVVVVGGGGGISSVELNFWRRVLARAGSIYAVQP